MMATDDQIDVLSAASWQFFSLGSFLTSTTLANVLDSFCAPCLIPDTYRFISNYIIRTNINTLRSLSVALFHRSTYHLQYNI